MSVKQSIVYSLPGKYSHRIIPSRSVFLSCSILLIFKTFLDPYPISGLTNSGNFKSLSFFENCLGILILSPKSLYVSDFDEQILATS